MDPSEWRTYTWDDEELNALKTIGLIRTGRPMVCSNNGGFFLRRAHAVIQDRYEFIWHAVDDQGVLFVAKLMKSYSPELAALRKLRSLPSSPRNIFVPGHLLECSRSSIYVMPELPDLMTAWYRPVTSEQLLEDMYKFIDVRMPDLEIAGPD